MICSERGGDAEMIFCDLRMKTEMVDVILPHLPMLVVLQHPYLPHHGLSSVE